MSATSVVISAERRRRRAARSNETIIGDGYIVAVELRGRLLARREGADAWWSDGVNPGAMAEDGKTLEGAVLRVRAAFCVVLVVLMAAAPDIDAFRAAVERFVNETDDKTREERSAAVAEVRRGALDLEGAARLNADLPVELRIDKQDMKPSSNAVTLADPAIAA